LIIKSKYENEREFKGKLQEGKTRAATATKIIDEIRVLIHV
jgi:hypothetical protein